MEPGDSMLRSQGFSNILSRINPVPSIDTNFFKDDNINNNNNNNNNNNHGAITD